MPLQLVKGLRVNLSSGPPRTTAEVLHSRKKQEALRDNQLMQDPPMIGGPNIGPLVSNRSQVLSTGHLSM